MVDSESAFIYDVKVDVGEVVANVDMLANEGHIGGANCQSARSVVRRETVPAKPMHNST
jgi:hypothetical protein